MMVLAWGSAALGAAEPGIEFSGVLTADGKTRIALTDKTSKVTRWLEPGEAFQGYSVVRYDPEGGAIFLRKDGEEHRLSLVAARFADASSPPAGASQAAPPDAVASNRIRSNLRQFFAAARQLQSERGLSQVGYADVVGPGKPIRELTPVAGEDYTGLSYSPNTSLLTVTTAGGTLVALDANPPTAGRIAGTPAPPPTNTAPPATGAPAPHVAAVPAPPTPIPSAPPAAAPLPAPNSPPTDSVASTPATPPNAALPPSTGDASPAPAAGSVPGPGSATDGLKPTGRATTTTTYTIQANDSLEQISNRTGVPVERLRELNPTILNGSSLPGGQTIRTQ